MTSVTTVTATAAVAPVMYKLVQITDLEVPSGAWFLPKLYQVAQIGRKLEWQIGYNGKTLVSCHGFVGGKMQTHDDFEAAPGSAWTKAKMRYINQVRQGYSLTGNAPTRTPLQKAVEWTPGEKLPYPMAVGPKIDGSRGCGEDLPEGGTVLMSKKKKISQLPVILEEITQLKGYLPYGYCPDFELYTPHLSHQELLSVNNVQLVESKKSYLVEAYIFDLKPPLGALETYPQRVELLARGLRAYWASREDKGKDSRLVFINYVIVYNEAELLWVRDLFLRLRFEGIMIRHMQGEKSIYKGRKNKCMYKHKLFKDEEGQVIGVEPCQGKDKELAKLVVRRLVRVGKKHQVAVDREGKEVIFRLKSMGYLHELAKGWLADPRQIVGKYVKYKFQDLTDDGVPKFANAIAIVDLDDFTYADDD